MKLLVQAVNQHGAAADLADAVIGFLLAQLGHVLEYRVQILPVQEVDHHHVVPSFAGAEQIALVKVQQALCLFPPLLRRAVPPQAIEEVHDLQHVHRHVFAALPAVAAGGGDNAVPQAVGQLVEQGPDPADPGLQGVLRGIAVLAAPDLPDDALGGNGLASFQNQIEQEGDALAAPDGQVFMENSIDFY